MTDFSQTTVTVTLTDEEWLTLMFTLVAGTPVLSERGQAALRAAKKKLFEQVKAVSDGVAARNRDFPVNLNPRCPDCGGRWDMTKTEHCPQCLLDLDSVYAAAMMFNLFLRGKQ